MERNQDVFAETRAGRPLDSRAGRLVAVALAFACGPAAVATDGFQPFVWAEGTMRTRVLYESSAAPPDGTRSSFTIEHTAAFPPSGMVMAEVSEFPLPMWPGLAVIYGEEVIDDAPEMAPPPIEAYEWRFSAFATSSGLGDARFDATVDFETDEPVRVLVRAEFEGWGEVLIGDLSGWYGPSLTVVPSPLYHEETILMPGLHTLNLQGGWLTYKGYEADGSVVLLVRFEPTGCGPADLNADGFIDGGDIFGFVDLFLGGEFRADLNGDSILDNGDLASFVQAFLEGCSF